MNPTPAGCYPLNAELLCQREDLIQITEYLAQVSFQQQSADQDFQLAGLPVKSVSEGSVTTTFFLSQHAEHQLNSSD